MVNVLLPSRNRSENRTILFSWECIKVSLTEDETISSLTILEIYPRRAVAMHFYTQNASRKKEVTSL